MSGTVSGRAHGEFVSRRSTNSGVQFGNGFSSQDLAISDPAPADSRRALLVIPSTTMLSLFYGTRRLFVSIKRNAPKEQRLTFMFVDIGPEL
jgi:hypothetical protein